MMLKRLFAFFVSFLILCTPVLAVESDDGEVVSDVSSAVEKVDQVLSDVSSLVNTADSETAPSESFSQDSSISNSFYILESPSDSDVDYGDLTDIPVGATITDISILSSVAPVTPDDASGLKSVLLSLLGDYDPVVVEYQYSNSNGSTSYLREVQPDYVWLCSCALFALVIYCLFRLGGALIRD